MDSEEHSNVIEAHGLAKTYRIWADPAARLQAPVLRTAASIIPSIGPLRKVRARLEGRSNSCWKDFQALKPLDLKIGRGECIGIIGRNGSGKSTLLQLICGILRPSSGTITVDGRVAALLELGSGFNHDFTGRENVYLNASILGVSRSVVDARMEEIEAFADIGEFIDQPVKTYSSGMMLRLAFSVQILMDPDVLIVDEALSVGDEPFQRKCFARLEQLRSRGVTILFVSHDLSAVVSLCDRAIMLYKGEMILDGDPKTVAEAYQRFNHAPQHRAQSLLHEIREEFYRDPFSLEGTAGEETLDAEEDVSPSFFSAEAMTAEDAFDPALAPQSTVVYDRIGAHISDIRLLDDDFRQVNILQRRQFYRYCYKVHFEERCEGINFAMLIKTLKGVDLGGARTYPAHHRIPCVEAGSTWEVCFRFQCLLTTGCYCMNAGVEGMIDNKPSYVHRVLDALLFRVYPEPDMIPTVTVDFLVEPSCGEITAHQATAQVAAGDR